MRLVDNLRKAEKKGARTIRRGMERAREEWADVERRLRQRMRIYPQKSKAAAAASGATAAELDDAIGPEASWEDHHKPIISVHGKDVEHE